MKGPGGQSGPKLTLRPCCQDLLTQGFFSAGCCQFCWGQGAQLCMLGSETEVLGAVLTTAPAGQLWGEQSHLPEASWGDTSEGLRAAGILAATAG